MRLTRAHNQATVTLHGYLVKAFAVLQAHFAHFCMGRVCLLRFSECK